MCVQWLEKWSHIFKRNLLLIVSKLAWAQVMAWCLMAPSHYLNQCWSNLWLQWVNSPPPSTAYIRQWIGSALVQIMACRLFGTEPLSKPMLPYCQLNSWEQISVKFKLEYYHFHSRKFIWKCRLLKWQPFCPVGDELMAWSMVGAMASAAASTVNGVTILLNEE